MRASRRNRTSVPSRTSAMAVPASPASASGQSSLQGSPPRCRVPVDAFVEHPLPAPSTGERLDQRAVRLRLRSGGPRAPGPAPSTPKASDWSWRAADPLPPTTAARALQFGSHSASFPLSNHAGVLGSHSEPDQPKIDWLASPSRAEDVSQLTDRGGKPSYS